MDADILRAIGLSEKQERHCREWCRQNGRPDLTRERYIAVWAPDVTFDIDNAMSLIPERAGWNLQGNTNVFYAVVSGHNGKGYTAALALTAAALRALASRDDAHQEPSR